MKKCFIVVTTMATVINSTMGSALPSNAIPYFTAEWHVTSETEKVLPISVFLIGESLPCYQFFCPCLQLTIYVPDRIYLW